MAVVQLRGSLAAGAVVPLGILPREARAKGAVFVAAPAADACQAEPSVLMPREVLQGGGPWLQTEPTPSQLGLVQEVHFLNAALMLHKS